MDYTWYMDVVSPGRDGNTNDTRVADLLGVLEVGVPPGWPPAGGVWSERVWVDGQSNRTGVPWKNREQYELRRAVARPAPAQLQRFAAAWNDAENPGGGVVPDYVGLEQDRQASDADLVSGTTTTLGDGRRLVHGVHQHPSNEFKSSSNFNCGSGTLCTGNSNTVTTPVIVEGHSVSVDINDQETGFNHLGIADREVQVRDPRAGGDVPAVADVSMEDLRHRGRSTTGTRVGTVKGYSDLAQEDTVSDEIHVSIDLTKQYRRSFGWNLKAPNLGKVNLLPFGKTPYTYGQFDNGERDPAMNEPYRELATSLALAHWGYRQPSVSRAYFTAGEGFSRNSLPDDGVTHPDDGVTHIRWPVNLYDLGWYLYELPHAGNRDGAWLTWLSEERGKRLVYSGYGQSAMDLTEANWEANLPVCRVEGEVITQENLVCAENKAENEDAGKPWLGTKDREEELVRGECGEFVPALRHGGWE